MFFDDAPHTPEALKQLLIEKLTSASWYSSAVGIDWELDDDLEDNSDDGNETDNDDFYNFGDYSNTQFTTLTFNNVNDTDKPILDSFAHQLSASSTHGAKAGCHMPANNIIQLGITVNADQATWFLDLQAKANQLDITLPDPQNTAGPGI